VQRRLTESADLFLRLDQSLKRSRSCASAHLRPAPPLWLTVVLCTCVFVRMCMRACKPKRARVAGSCVRALVSQWAFVCPHGSAGCVGMRRLPSGVLADQAQEALQELRQGTPYCAGADVSCRLSLVADRHALRLSQQALPRSGLWAPTGRPEMLRCPQRNAPVCAATAAHLRQGQGDCTTIGDNRLALWPTDSSACAH
jgi:hypothetical protein